MANLILPRRFTQQPQYPVEIDRSHPLINGKTSVILGSSYSNDPGTKKAYTVASGISQIVTPYGLAPYGKSGANIVLPSIVDTTYPYTIAVISKGMFNVIGKQHIDTSTGVLWSGGFKAQTQIWDSSIPGFRTVNTTVSETAWLKFVVTMSADKVMSLYVNNVLIGTQTFVNISSDSLPEFSIKFQDGSVYGQVPIAIKTDKCWSQSEIIEWGNNPWQIFRRSPQVLYFDTASGGATTLTIADAVHGHTADNLGLTSSHMLTIADSTHAHSADNAALTTQILLALADALHGHTSDNLTLSTTGSTSLVAADATHAHTADNLSLTALSVLVVAEALHAHLADNVVLSVAGTTNLIVADALHGHSADNLSLTSQLLLSIAEAAHAHASDNIVITSQHVLAVADALHAHMADNLTLSDAPALIVADASHAHTADNLGLTSASLLAIADAAHAHMADNVDLTYADTLSIVEAIHAHLADNVTLSLVALRTVELLIAAARDTQLTAPTRDTLLESRHAIHG